MKVICKCCHKAFNYDVYSGLCPNCGRVYRRSSRDFRGTVEADMIGEYHVHADSAGLNRGIEGVEYNHDSSYSARKKQSFYGEDPEADRRGTSIQQRAAAVGQSFIPSQPSANVYKSNVINTSMRNPQVQRTTTYNGKKKANNTSLGVIFFVIFVVMIILSMFGSN